MACRNTLVLCSYRGGSATAARLAAACGFDLAAACFAGTPELEGVARFHLTQPGSKVPNYLALFDRFPEMLTYRWFVFLDDDLEFSPSLVTDLVRTMRERDLDLAQPALDRSGVFSWPHLVRPRPRVTVATNFVEIQAFALSRRMLRAAFPYFALCETGFGLDVALSALVDRDGFRAAILGALVVRHPRRPREETIRGRNPRFATEAQGILRRIAFCFDRTPDLHRIRRGLRFAGLPAYPARALVDALAVFRRQSARRMSTARYPHYAFTAAERACLERSLSAGSRYLEYGPGESTRIAEAAGLDVLAVEHDRAFFERAERERGPRTRILFAPPDDAFNGFEKFGADWNRLTFSEHDEKDGSFATFQSYVESPPAGPYDRILVDGRARVHCLRHVAEAGLLSPKGLLLVHDFDRRWYSVAHLWFDWIETVDRLAVFRSRATTAPAWRAPADSLCSRAAPPAEPFASG